MKHVFLINLMSALPFVKFEVKIEEQIRLVAFDVNIIGISPDYTL